jgi:hypothetical protein
MSTISIASPGVQINEIDLSLIARPSGATNVFITGFANQGPTDEIINVGSISEYEDTFGLPTNAAERYLYHSARQILTTSPANLLVTRMPYGSGAGEGYANQHTALVYAISADASTYQNASAYNIMAPVSILLTDDQYLQLIENNVTWNSTNPYFNGGAFSINTFADITSYGGLVVLDSTKTSVDNLNQGYYIALADNSNNNPATDFNCVTSVQAANSIAGIKQSFTSVASARFNFTLTQAFSAGGTSLSYIIEQFPRQYDFGAKIYNDCITLAVFKIRTSTYAQDTVVLDASLQEGYTGSFNALRTQNNVNGGAPVTFALNNIVNTRSSNIKALINPWISTTGQWTDSVGNPAKKVRVDNSAKSLYSNGVYISNTDQIANDVGNIPQKLQRTLQRIDDLDVNLDVVAEAGLGTIWYGASTKQKNADASTFAAYGSAMFFDENYYTDISALTAQTGDAVVTKYSDVISQFVSFANNTRKDHVFIADPLRFIFVQGKTKIVSTKNYVYSQNIYWPLKNLFAGNVSSYAATYGNWLLVNDTASNSKVWVPSSGFAAAIFASTSQQNYPWSAPAGFNRAVLSNVIDIAVNPTQKQRDLLYKINVNPIAFFPGDGFVIYGQKTLYTKPSAFDRINVRRLFLTLEKTTKNLLKYYVFEPNTFTTRTRLANSLAPVFDKAKNSDGLYDYKIVCDERNNTPDVIDNNQLNISIYIQPVRTAEFILCDFIATRTGVNFDELIGQNIF